MIVVTQEMLDAGRAAYHKAAREAGSVDFAGAKIEACYRAMVAAAPQVDRFLDPRTGVEKPITECSREELIELIQDMARYIGGPPVTS
jgi:hypothetical protein